MGSIHNELRRGQWSVALKNALGASKSEGGIERFGETLTPVIDLWDQPEWALLRSEFLWSFHQALGATALEFAMIAVVNPANSNQIAVFERIIGASGVAATTILLAFQTEAQIQATLTFQSRTPVRDTRRGANAFLDGYTGSDTTLFTNVLERVTPVAAFQMTEFFTPPWIIRPGTGMLVMVDTVNISLRATFAGRVHAALPGEMTLSV